jgi:hypothetical protein
MDKNKPASVLLMLLLLVATQAYAGNEMHSVQLKSCRLNICTKLETEKLYRSDLRPGILSFSSAKMTLVDLDKNEKVLKTFQAGDGYFDLRKQVIVLRSLKKSSHRELIYSVLDGQFAYF